MTPQHAADPPNHDRLGRMPFDGAQGATAPSGAAPSPGALRVDVVADERGFDGLREEWTRLVRSSRDPCPFLSYEWHRTWWEVYELPGRSLRIMLVRDGATLVGLAPLWRQAPAPWSARCVRFIGTGEPESEEASSTQLDVVAAPGYESAVAQSVWRELVSRSAEWDVLAFDNMLESSQLAASCRSAAGAGFTSRERSIGADYRIDLPADFPAYLQGLKQSIRDGMRRNMAKLEKAGRVTCTIAQRAEEVEGAMRELARLNETRQVAKGRIGAFRSERFVRFQRLVATAMLPQGGAQLGLLALDGRNVGGWLNFQAGTRTCAYIVGFDAGDRTVRSLGLANNGFRIQHAIGTGCGVFDFLRGDADSYKADYGCRSEPMASWLVYNATARGGLALRASLIMQWLRRLKARFARGARES